MLIKEQTVVEREIHLAPCLECGSSDIELIDSNYSSFNIGGGECKKCRHKATGNVSCMPKVDHLAAIWNAGNDIPALIRAEEKKIAEAAERIAALKAKSGPAANGAS